MIPSPVVSKKILPVYVQVPFCPERCDYCSIPVSTRLDEATRYTDALSREFTRVSPHLEQADRVTLYLGGGSPTSLPIGDLARILDLFRPLLSRCLEWTIESRPEGLTPEVLSLISRVGVTRLSIGIESLGENRMAFLGRSAPVMNPVTLLSEVKKTFSGSVSMDFIIGGGEFDRNHFLEMSRKLFDAGLDHLSLYPLTLESRSSLHAHFDRVGGVAEVEELAAIDWIFCINELSRTGWQRYEVANCARSRSARCLHNVLIWEGEDYLGLGSGAHQRVRGVRTENVRSFREYAEWIENNRTPFSVREELTPEGIFSEQIVTRLRLDTGVRMEELTRWIPEPYVIETAQSYERKGFIRTDHWKEERRITCTDQGMNFLDDLLEDLLGGVVYS